MKLLEGKVVLITGGSRGIGKSIAEVMADHGADVAFTYRSSEEQAKEVLNNIEQKGVKAAMFQSDASDFDAAEALIKAVIEQFGKIDVLINNAGITKDTLMLRMTEDQWDAVINVNLKSVFNLTKHALRAMLRARSGSIINMSSVVGVFGNAGQANYAASKAGIIGFSKSIAKEVGSRGIRCNVIAPGFIETEMTAAMEDKAREGFETAIPLKRLGATEDISNACVYLGSDLSTYVTGQVLSVCGGLNM